MEKIEEERENKENQKLIITILISSILGGFMSLYIFQLYQKDASILTNPKLETIYAIGIQAIIYMFYLGIALLIAWIIVKVGTLAIEILLEPITLFFNFIERIIRSFLIKLGFKVKPEPPKETETKEIEIAKIYRANSDFFNFIFILLFCLWIIFYKLEFVFNKFSTKQIIIGLIVIIFYAIFYLYRAIRKRK